MNDKFKNKYRIETTRLNGWDYGKNGYYFVTICTKNRDATRCDECRDAMHCVSTNIAMRGDEYRDAMRCDNNCRDAMHCVSTII